MPATLLYICPTWLACSIFCGSESDQVVSFPVDPPVMSAGTPNLSQDAKPQLPSTDPSILSSYVSKQVPVGHSYTLPCSDDTLKCILISPGSQLLCVSLFSLTKYSPGDSCLSRGGLLLITAGLSAPVNQHPLSN